jgi:hypothetical protein
MLLGACAPLPVGRKTPSGEFLCGDSKRDPHEAGNSRTCRSPGLDHRQGVKRATVGEYSREFSAKVFNGQSRLMELGFRQGGGMPMEVLRPQASQIRYTQTDDQLERA